MICLEVKSEIVFNDTMKNMIKLTSFFNIRKMSGPDRMPKADDEMWLSLKKPISSSGLRYAELITVATLYRKLVTIITPKIVSINKPDISRMVKQAS